MRFQPSASFLSLFCLACLSVLTFSASSSYAGQGLGSSFCIADKMPGLARTCLPVKGRMLTDRSASCHCPPESLCPKDMNEWVNSPILPPYIAGVCCKIPFQCTISYTTSEGEGTFSSNCGTREENEPRFVQICTQYDAKIVDGAQEQDAADFDETLPENIETERRELGATAYNECYESQCQAKEEGFFDNPEASNFDAFVSCELSCREKAASVLSITLSKKEKGLEKVTADMSAGVEADKLFHPLNASSFGFDEKPESQFPSSELDEALQCGNVVAPVVCMAAERLEQCGGDNVGGGGAGCGGCDGPGVDGSADCGVW